MSFSFLRESHHGLSEENSINAGTCPASYELQEFIYSTQMIIKEEREGHKVRDEGNMVDM